MMNPFGIQIQSRWARRGLISTILAVVMVFAGSTAGFGQVSPAEIQNPRLKTAESAYLSQLISLNRAIQSLQFPFPFKLSRYVGLPPKDQASADTRGLEFVKFHDQVVLKISGNYNAAYNAEMLNQNQRAARVFEDVAAPILRLLPEEISSDVPCDAVGLEISYHVRAANRGFDYEGVEDLVVVLNKTDALTFAQLTNPSAQQDVLNRSEVYLDGKEFGLALNARDAIPLDALDKAPPSPRDAAASPATPATPSDSDNRLAGIFGDVPPSLPRPAARPPVTQRPAPSDSAIAPATDQPEKQAVPLAPATPADAAQLQTKFQAQLDELGKEGAAKFHFVPYAPPSFIVFQKRIYLQLTLRNPHSFDAEAGSIYKRAAQSFDLFLAPQLQALLAKVPAGSDYGGLDITVLNEFSSKASPSSEAIEFICPLKPLRQFAAAEITNQDLINQSVVLVNGVRIALNLQQVE